MSKKLTRAILLSVALTAIFAASQVSAQYAYSNYSSQKNSTVSVFAATDTKSNDSGYGVSLTLKSDPTAALTYVHFENFDVFQVSKSKPTQLAGYPVNVGVVLGYANSRVKEDFTPYGPYIERPDGLLSGLEASVSLGKPQGGFSVDLKASSLTESVNPIKWLTNPDLLWLGAGVTFKY